MSFDDLSIEEIQVLPLTDANMQLLTTTLQTTKREAAINNFFTQLVARYENATFQFYSLKELLTETDEILNHIPARLQEGYVQINRHSSAVESEYIDIGHSLYYFNKPLQLVYELPLSAEEIKTLEQIKLEDGDISPYILTEYVKVLQAKQASYFCQVWEEPWTVSAETDTWMLKKLTELKADNQEMANLLQALSHWKEYPTPAHLLELKFQCIACYSRYLNTYENDSSIEQRAPAVQILQFLRIFVHQLQQRATQRSEALETNVPVSVSSQATDGETVTDSNQKAKFASQGLSTLSTFGLACCCLSIPLVLAFCLKDEHKKMGFFAGAALSGCLFFGIRSYFVSKAAVIDDPTLTRKMN